MSAARDWKAARIGEAPWSRSTTFLPRAFARAISFSSKPARELSEKVCPRAYLCAPLSDLVWRGFEDAAAAELPAQRASSRAAVADGMSVEDIIMRVVGESLERRFRFVYAGRPSGPRLAFQ